MSNEDYVSYELALKLKACGFDEPCNYGYSVKMRLEPEVSFGEPKMVHSKSPKNYNDNRKGIEKGLSFCSAPHIYHAQKWLREEYGIHIDVCTYSDYSTDADGNVCDRWDFWGFELYAIVGGERIAIDDDEYDFYEQALSAGIASALELIEQENK